MVLPVPLSFHQSGSVGMSRFAIEDATGKHICVVFDEGEARALCEAVNVSTDGPKLVRVTGLLQKFATIGLADPRLAEILLAEVRTQSKAALAGE